VHKGLKKNEYKRKYRQEYVFPCQSISLETRVQLTTSKSLYSIFSSKISTVKLSRADVENL